MPITFSLKRAICSSLILLTACSPKTTPTAVVVAEKENQTIAVNMIEGQKIYQANCGRCHELPNPAALTQREWKPIMYRMSRKARLSEVEKVHSMAYVMANAKANSLLQQ